MDEDQERTSRGQWLSRAAVGSVALSATGAVAATFAAAKAPSKLTPRDRKVLEFALTFEHLQATFYAEALHAGNLSGEPRQFAEVVGREERAHLRYVVDLLGTTATTQRRYRFSHAVSSTKHFVDAAVTLEEIALAAYNGQAENVSRATLAKIARVMSVESRHAAWARGLAGKVPAPVAADVPMSAAAALKAIGPYVA